LEPVPEGTASSPAARLNAAWHFSGAQRFCEFYEDDCRAAERRLAFFQARIARLKKW
jgi:hypothetical protein